MMPASVLRTAYNTQNCSLYTRLSCRTLATKPTLSVYHSVPVATPLTSARWVRQGIRIALTDGATHAVDSNEIAFKLACQYAFRDAFTRAGPVILEPIMAVEVRSHGTMSGCMNRSVSKCSASCSPTHLFGPGRTSSVNKCSEGPCDLAHAVRERCTGTCIGVLSITLSRSFRGWQRADVCSVWLERRFARRSSSRAPSSAT